MKTRAAVAWAAGKPLEIEEVDLAVRPDAREADDPSSRLDPFEGVVAGDPVAHDRQVLPRLRVDVLERSVTPFEHTRRELFVDHRAADEDLLLRG